MCVPDIECDAVVIVVCVDGMGLITVVVDVVECIRDSDVELDAIVVVAADMEPARLVILVCVDSSSCSCASTTSGSSLSLSTSSSADIVERTCDADIERDAIVFVVVADVVIVCVDGSSCSCGSITSTSPLSSSTSLKSSSSGSSASSVSTARHHRDIELVAFVVDVVELVRDGDIDSDAIIILCR